MIRSGRTKSIKAEMEEWYEGEYGNANVEWIWGFHKEAIQDLLDTRKEVPFRCFLVRYIFEVHKSELIPSGADEILALMEENAESDYKTAPLILKKLTDLIFNDFVSNQFYVRDSETKRIKIRGSVNRERPVRGRVETQPALWDKEVLFRKLKASVITEDELFAFAFGLNMDYDDISYMLKKALRRTDFNLWNWQEFLLYLTYKFAKGNLFEFYLKLKEVYEDEKNSPKEYQWRQNENFSTVTIQTKTDLIAKMIQEEQYAVALDADGKIPAKMVEYIREYKYLMENSGDYTRTIAKESYRLLEAFKKNIAGVEKEARAVSRYGEWNRFFSENGGDGFHGKGAERLFENDKKREMSTRYASGNVLVYYDPADGLNIPEKTVFVKIDKKSGKRIEFESKKAVKIAPNTVDKIEIKIPVTCLGKKEKLTTVSKGEQIESKCSYLSEITKKGKNIIANCVAGKKIDKGERFYTKNKNGEEIVLLTEKEVEAIVFEKIEVICLLPGQTAAKDEITDCSITDWKNKFEKIGNSKIGFLQKSKSQSATGGVLYNYLYQSNKTESCYAIENALEQEYAEKLAEVLEGTRLSSTKLSNIANQKAEHITRNDILTLSFLAYMSKVENERYASEEQVIPAARDYKNRYGEFIQETKKILNKCGYYELYAPNPYDSLLVCLLSSNEAIDAYKNLWSWYLTFKERG